MKSPATHSAPGPARSRCQSAACSASRAGNAAYPAQHASASTQDLYTGMSGQFAAMSEFLWRGYNVAIPAVDVGEDIFVVRTAMACSAASR